MEPTKKSIELNPATSMFSVVEQMNAGYDKFFDSKPKTPAVRSQCYSNYMSCGTKSNNTPEMCAEIKTEEGISEKQPDIVQQFFPQHDDAKQNVEGKKPDQVVVGSGCCKYLVKKEK